MPREVYMKDKGNGSCKLMLNPSDMQIGAHIGETQWVMGDQFMQAFYTIFDHEKRRVGIIESINQWDSESGSSSSGSDPNKVLKDIISGDSKKESSPDSDDKSAASQQQLDQSSQSNSTKSSDSEKPSSSKNDQETVQTSEEQAFFNFEIK